MLAATDFGKAVYGFVQTDFEQLERLASVQRDLEKPRFREFFTGGVAVADKIENQVDGGANVVKWTAPMLQVF